MARDLDERPRLAVHSASLTPSRAAPSVYLPVVSCIERSRPAKIWFEISRSVLSFKPCAPISAIASLTDTFGLHRDPPAA